MEQWPTALSEMYRALKEGGDIQIMETDIERLFHFNGPAGNKTLDVLKALQRDKGLITDTEKNLTKMMKEAGFVDIKVSTETMSVGKSSGKYGDMATLDWLLVCKNLSAVLKGLGWYGFANSEEEWNKLVDDCVEELQEDEPGDCGTLFFCARKPAA